MDALAGLVLSFIMFIILLVGIIKFFGMCNDIDRIRVSLDKFIKYYSDVQAWKQNVCNGNTMDKPLG
jgi:hypothetical protein